VLSDGFLVTINGQKEINSLTFLIDSAVEVFPLTLDVRFVHPAALADRTLLAFAESSLQFRRELLEDVRMIDLYTRSAIISFRFRSSAGKPGTNGHRLE
jgi:hypothetical protein